MPLRTARNTVLVQSLSNDKTRSLQTPVSTGGSTTGKYFRDFVEVFLKLRRSTYSGVVCIKNL